MKIIGLMIVSFFEIWLLYYLLFGIFWKEEGMRRRDKVNMWSCILILGSMLTFNRNVAFFSYSLYWLVILLVFFSVLLIRRKDCFFVIGCVITYNSILALLDFSVGFLNMCFLNGNFMNTIYFRTHSLLQCVIYMISRCILLCVFLIGKKKIHMIGRTAGNYQNILLVTGLIFSLIIIKCQFLMYGMIVEKDGRNPRSAGVLILELMAIILFVMILIIRYKNVETENKLLTLREKVFEEDYTNLLEMVERNGQLFHDMKNHFLVLRDYAKQKDAESIAHYIEEMGEIFFTERNKFWTGNRILDLILSQKKSVAEKSGIKFQIWTLRIPELSIKESEICALFGNLLDNALEACEKIQDGEKWITVKIELQEQLMFVNISNSIATVPIKKKGVFVSGKPNKNIHGYGLKSVEKIVNNHGGIITYDIKEMSFQVNISFFALAK